MKIISNFFRKYVVWYSYFSNVIKKSWNWTTNLSYQNFSMNKVKRGQTDATENSTLSACHSLHIRSQGVWKISPGTLLYFFMIDFFTLYYYLLFFFIMPFNLCQTLSNFINFFLSFLNSFSVFVSLSWSLSVFIILFHSSQVFLFRKNIEKDWERIRKTEKDWERLR